MDIPIRIHTLIWWMVYIILLHNCLNIPSVAVVFTAAYSTKQHSVKFDIIPPKLRSDWVQISRLMVDCLPETPPNMFDDLSWILYQKYTTQQRIYQQLVQNARAMQDMKYAILIAKVEPPKHGGGGNVIGVIEFGVSMIHGNNSRFDPQDHRKLLMIGTIGIDPQYRKMGVASALIRQCETIVQQQWKETEIYAHIEETNHKAIQCFTKLGYTTNINNNDTNATRVDLVSVRRRQMVECVPHLLFVKQLQNGTVNSDVKKITTFVT
jgi:ribosomal protein S18 acetylase RimI-like enzyme